MNNKNRHKSFYIAQVGDGESKKETKTEAVVETKPIEEKTIGQEFISPFYGRNVKDEHVFPYVKYGNEGSQYESLRDKRLKDEEELEKQYGHKYYEFSEVIQSSRKRALESEIDQAKAVTEEAPRIREDIYEEELTFNDDRVYDEVAQDPYFSKEIIEEEIEEKDDFYEEEVVPVKKASPKRLERKPIQKRKDDFDVASLKVEPIKGYQTPPMSLLKKGKGTYASDTESINLQRKIIDNTLADFKIGARVVNYSRGPAVTQFEVKVDPGVNVDRVRSISKNLQMNLAVRSIRIQAPIPGKPAVGIEVPNKKTDLVLFGDLLDNPDFLNDNNPLNVVLGLDLGGKPVYADIGKMPHGLIAGATGSGKSVCINTMIISMLYKAHPDELKMILIDPKVVEFSSYEDIPHLAAPIITDPKLATASLKWTVDEMDNRYQLFKHFKVRDIKGFNELAERNKKVQKLPYIVIIIDEFADLMSVASSDVEDYVRRIAQKARAAGIHLIVATQRPSTDIIKGTIKANIPSRIAFAVSSQVDSMTILDKAGAEKLLGRGDMLFNDGIIERRVQGAYISFEEIVEVTSYIKDYAEANFMFTEEELREQALASLGPSSSDYDATYDEYFPLVARFVVENDSASINRVQKQFSIGFNRAQGIMEALELHGIVSENLGSRSREVLVDMDELEEILEDILG